MKFGDNLKSIRKSKKVSQEDLADKLGVSRQSVSKWETGENYPSMQNIVCLCDIFHCKINDLVHEDFDDLDFMDEEIKMSVVKLNEKEQKNVKTLSKILSLIGKISAIVVRVGIGFLAIAMIFIPIGLSHIDFKDNQIEVSGNVIKVDKLDDGIRISSAQNEHIVISDFNTRDVEGVMNGYNKFGKWGMIGLMEAGFAFLIAFMVILSLALTRLEKLFININEGDTPFTLDNVDHIKKMAIYLIASIIISAIGSTIINIAFSSEAIIEFNLFNVVEIIFLFAMSYIFEYGTKIQKDSNGKMYGKEE
ncbi:MAG: helix-turn-helix domain-containing protein [Bacilli bacterium]|nr:helix-turn-helix domain-containing protein [Bacilli bacterium]